jgi:hypothetical protein
VWKTIALILLGLAVIVAGAALYGARRWQSATEAMHERLEAARLPIEPATYSTGELAGLPAPVQRYFRAVLQDGQPVIAAVRVQHTGTFNMGESAGRWVPFTSNQRVVTRRPGFDWEARMPMMPGLPVRVHDAYIAGEGILHASLLGLVSVVNMRGTPEMAEGELMRFFAEAAWYPTALLPSQGVQWQAVDDRSAMATLHDGDLELTMLFRFGENDLIEAVRAEARGRTVGEEIIPTPWEGRFSHYERRDGLLIPLEGEVAWMLPEGAQPYWRGRITDIQYEFAQ